MNEIENKERVREEGIDKPLILAATITLALKLGLEKKLYKKLSKAFAILISDIASVYRKYGFLPMYNEFRQKVEDILKRHYIKVSLPFREFLRTELGIRLDDIGFNKRLSDVINIRAFNRAHLSANQITRTIEKETDNALRLILAAAALQGLRLTWKETAKQLKKTLSAVFGSRIGTISATETTNAAEQTKLDELLQLKEMNIKLPDGRNINELTAKKQWIARFINTRPWHEDAHGQIRNYNEPYDVKDEKLMFPTDISLGASAANTINCYCSSQIFFN